MALPIFQSDNQALGLMQTSWASQLNPLLFSPLAAPILLKNVSLVSGDNTINHLLGKSLIGWAVVRQRSAATLYDKQDVNSMPSLTLVLNASASVVVDLIVF